MENIQTYAVYRCNDGSADAAHNLSAHDVVRYIYSDDGADYRLAPKMITNQFDDEGKELPDVQETTDGGDLVFNVYFKSGRSYPWFKGGAECSRKKRR